LLRRYNTRLQASIATSSSSTSAPAGTFFAEEDAQDKDELGEDEQGEDKSWATLNRAKLKGKYIDYRVYARVDIKVLLKDLQKLDVSPEEVIAQVSADVSWLSPSNPAIAVLIKKNKDREKSLPVSPVYEYETRDWPKTDGKIDEFWQTAIDSEPKEHKPNEK
jgi:hypothetical protein